MTRTTPSSWLTCFHHLPDDVKLKVLAFAVRTLPRDGVLIVKDINTRPFPKLAFTWLLDVTMTRGFDMWYWSAERLERELVNAGLTVSHYRVSDILPYPHVLLVGRKP